MKTLNLLHRVFFATSIVLALFVVFLLFPQRLDFKATEAEIQYWSQPAPAALLEESAEYNRKTQKVFDDLGLGDYRREINAIIREFVGSLTPDELIYFLYLGADGDHAAMDKFRQERGFYYPDEARRFLPNFLYAVFLISVVGTIVTKVLLKKSHERRKGGQL